MDEAASHLVCYVNKAVFTEKATPTSRPLRIAAFSTSQTGILRTLHWQDVSSDVLWRDVLSFTAALPRASAVLLYMVTLPRRPVGVQCALCQPQRPSSSAHSSCLRHSISEHCFQVKGTLLVTEGVGVMFWVCKFSVNMLLWVKIQYGHVKKTSI